MKAGDVVRLKSGGPRMTIMSITRDQKYKQLDNALCAWFTGEAPYEYEQHAEFTVATLELLNAVADVKEGD